MSNKVRTNNTLTDSSANAGAEGAIAQGENARFANVGANQISVSGGGDVKVTDSSPEALAAAFNFGRDALAALQTNTERQVAGAVDAARQASEAAARLASGDSRPKGPDPVETAAAPAAAKPSALAAIKPVTLVIVAAIGVVAWFIFGRSPNRSRA